MDRQMTRIRRCYGRTARGRAVTRDASKLVYLARFESGYDLWVQDLREHETKLLAKLNVQTGA
jgi:hypothetical protein